MIVIASLAALALGFWMLFALVGAVLKLVFGIVGGLFSVIASLVGALVGGVAMLLVAPVIVLALTPVLLPVGLLALLVWAIARSTRKPDVVVVPASR